MRFIVYGAGAIGSTIGGHLFRAGYNVILIGNQKHMDEIRSKGLRLITPEETYVLNIPTCKKSEELYPFKEDDVVLLTAKSQHTILCLGQLKNSGAKRTLPIFCVQNSIINESIASRIFDRIYGVVVSVPSIFLHPGEVINSILGKRGFLEIGLYPYGVDILACEVAIALEKAGFSSGVNRHVMKAKATKCLQNLTNAFEAITNKKPQFCDGGIFVQAVKDEAMEVWKVAGIEWEGPEFEQRVRAGRGLNKMPEGYESEIKHSSSWMSLVRGTGNIETEALNGDVVKLGKSLGIKTPYNETLWMVAQEMAMKRNKPGKYTVEDLVKKVKTYKKINLNHF